MLFLFFGEWMPHLADPKIKKSFPHFLLGPIVPTSTELLQNAPEAGQQEKARLRATCRRWGSYNTDCVAGQRDRDFESPATSETSKPESM